ncbi:leucine--tRNA ligase [Candidatus Falkowbacteria bacterium CG11_big_fil_rev_8_21_14_0_20_39_10]|uniref:Leucine--tRNA ligase n=1 Tax=Candidatus Falkowbacteria bacterium CG11_big_fil_rev_8_21_14_0_20_39_10 TaxID=1974570 RepID=A0A2M6KA16_9BACT|nr:MAG: leucine--tRNA ligase [Candidatus Falkowbacteria bacterium CG11_big_fil_rev_8_21_14_0_20_39_10]
MKKYDFNKIEKKWAQKWVKDKVFTSDLAKVKNPYYALFMFPYPSAEGLHIGNFYAFTCVDVMAKYRKLQGRDVFEPIGWDAFGIHSENYALQIGQTPMKMLSRTIKNFRKQLSSAGLGCDWTREVDTTTPEYYKWTQWIFTKLLEKGLAFQKKAILNFCPSCKTVLADEQIESGACERCGTAPEKKEMKQWFFKITAFSQRLLDGLPKMDWSEITKSAQKNWIGRSEGAMVKFSIADCRLPIEIFTTRPDTLFGATYFVLSPEHPLVAKITTKEQKKQVEKYIRQAGAKSELERTENKEKTGVFTGAYALNPINKEKIPVWIADYVLMGYGTGAIMAVPAHDERDWEFAKKQGIEIRQVVAPYWKVTTGNAVPKPNLPTIKRNNADVIVKHWEKDEYLILNWKETGWTSFVVGGIEDNESPEAAAAREVREETGFKNIKFVKKIWPQFYNFACAVHKNRNQIARRTILYVELKNSEQEKITSKEKAKHSFKWCPGHEIGKLDLIDAHKIAWNFFNQKEAAFIEAGVNINSDFLDGLTTEEAKKKMIAWLEEKGLGKGTVNYRLRDWCISRQRYWGPPVPIIHCPNCGPVAVPEKDLPVKLPELDKGWEPAGDGRGPLAKVKGFMEAKCPKCGGEAEREPDVMDNFLDSAWYFFRYLSHDNKKEIFDKKRGKKWLPVDLYVGGNEHAVLHLMYTRFITMALHDLGLIDFDNPFKRFRANGMILKDGAKMSKSKGNVINPEEYGKKVGYDALKTYLLFLGPMSENRSFTDQGVQGARRWVEKIYKLKDKALKSHKDSPEVIKKLHQTIRVVTEDFEDQKYNTAVARLMELTNVFSVAKQISPDSWQKFLALIAPFTPALAEELWRELGEKNSIFNSKSWPSYDKKLVKDETINLVVQINGKLRDTIEVEAGIGEEEAGEVALRSEKIQKWIKGKKVVKVIFIKGKLVNIVIK